MVTGFVLYDNRSGSTLLSALLNRYRDVSVGPESDYIFRILEDRRPLHTLEHARALLEALRRESRFDELGLDTETILSRLVSTGISRPQLIRGVTDMFFAEYDPAARWRFVKGPRLQYHVSSLCHMFPEARFVHIVRDGRAVFASKVKSRSSGGELMSENLVHSAAVWRRKLRLAEALGHRHLLVRFEDLVNDPETEMAALLDKLLVPSEGRVHTKSQADFARRIGDAHRQLHVNVVKPPEPGIADRWQSEMSPRQVFHYEMLNHRELAKYAYPLVEFKPPYGMQRMLIAGYDHLRFSFALLRNRVGRVITWLSAGSVRGRSPRRWIEGFRSRIA